MSVCPACSRDNPDGAKFCAECGNALASTCPSCGSTARPGAGFCIECGAALGSPARPPSSPEAVIASGERKQITVLFADVAGSMDLQEDLDAEVWAEIMGRFVAILAEGVRKFGGTVDKFTGDGIMALFGAPVAQEDHARRACHAAWHLTKAIGQYSEELRREQDMELHVRLGLNSGEVVVGRVGEDVTLDPTALGHAVGLAQRMEAIAEPGKAYVTQRTARLVEGWFDVEDLGPRPVKGSRGPLRVYALEGPVASPPVLHGAGLRTAPLVGREREMALLEDALAGTTHAEAQVIGVVGEAGVGKSRLCDEFARSVVKRGITVRRAAGVSHARDVPLLPILALLRDYFSIGEEETPEQAREKIAGRLIALDRSLEDALPLLFDFLEVPDPGCPAPRLAPDVRLRRLFEALRRVTQRRSERETLVLLLEDLHWFDPQSLAFAERLIPSFSGTRTLVLTNFRPEFSPPWARHPSYRRLPVGPLDASDVGQLLDRLLGRDPSLRPLASMVADQTGGNPFFVEEVVRALAEDGTLAGEPGSYGLVRSVDTIAVPPTIQDTLAARIDRLGEADKNLLQSAAVIGRNFTEAVLRAVLGLPEAAVATALTNLCAAEFIEEEVVGASPGYRFWHPLTQDVAYRSLLRERRASLHTAVGRAIIATEPERLNERAALLAFHFERAGNRLEAAGWNDRAGDYAARSDIGEAMRRWRVALVHLDSAPVTDEALRLGVLARNRLIRYGARTGMDADEAGRLYADARAAAERVGDPRQLASVTLAYGTHLVWRGNSRAGLDLYLEAAHLSDQTNDRDARAGHWAVATLIRSWTGSIPEGLQAVETVFDLCGEDPNVGVSVLGFSPLAIASIARAEFLALCGQPEAAGAALDDAVDGTRERSEAEWLVIALSVYPRLARSPKELEESLGRAQEAVRIAQDSGNASADVVALSAVGIAQAGLGRFHEADTTLRGALDEARQRQVALCEEPRLLAHLARTQLGMGRREAAHRAADEAVEVAHRQGARVFECFALLTRHQIRRTTDGSHDRGDLIAALDLVNQTGALFYEPFIREELGRLHHDEAELREALRLYRQIGAAGDARRLEGVLLSGE